MILLFDIGNTHTHLGLADQRAVRKQSNITTASWSDKSAPGAVQKFARGCAIEGAAICSVVPLATPKVIRFVRQQWSAAPLELSATTIKGVAIRYPKPETIGPDRLANSVAVRHHYGAPSVVVDFGTAVTFDVVNSSGEYVGGIIAPGLSAMTEYLHEKTALLPKIRIRETSAVIGKNTREAMLIGAVHGYRGLIRELLNDLRRELRCRRLPVIATGGYARLIAARMPEIMAVDPLLTLEGLRLEWLQSRKSP